MIQLKEPVRAEKSENYLAVLVDADDVRHYWLPDGTYDGYDRPCQPQKETKDADRKS